MSSTKKRVFLTGATGNMGRAVLRELVDRADRFDVIALVLPTAHDRELQDSSGVVSAASTWVALSGAPRHPATGVVRPSRTTGH